MQLHAGKLQGLGSVLNQNKRAKKHHTDHCLDSLREQLMCTADIGVLPYVRIKGQDRAYPDFPAAPHMCRNFDDIRSWVVDAQVAGLEPKLLHNVETGDIVLDEIP